ncbi:MAG: DUF4349 domain-containing protein, partial [Leptospiraceae bacterium]|nr:DUF4349 domain-containing protein [Leptospiraceae bacterium]
MKYLIILFFFFSFSCNAKRESNATTQTAPMLSGNMEADEEAPSPKSESRRFADNTKVKERSKETPSDKSDAVSPSPTNPVNIISKSRLLEYTIHLNYETEDFLKSRQRLIELAKSYGFIKKSTTSFEGRKPGVNLEIWVQVDKLYDSLLEFDNIGKLKYENIQTNDLTEENALSQKKVYRETIRVQRREKALVPVSKSNTWNWKDREDALERSENNLDSAEFEKWKIMDKISWAKVSVHLQSSHSKETVKVPNFIGAFYEAITFSLNIV